MKKHWGLLGTGLASLLVGLLAIPLLISGAHQEKLGYDPRFEAPGAYEMFAEQPGFYTLWHYFDTVWQGEHWRRPVQLPEGTRVRVFGAGEELAFQPNLPEGSDQSSQIHIPFTAKDRHGNRKSTGVVFVQRPGPLRVEVIPPEGELVVGFTKFKVPGITGLAILGAFVSLVLVAAGFAMSLAGALRLFRSRKPATA